MDLVNYSLKKYHYRNKSLTLKVSKVEYAKLKTISKKISDPIWEMPLYQNYNTLIKSDIADIVKFLAFRA